MSDELVIDESNFDQYFFDVRKHGPKAGQIMACYSAIAEWNGNFLDKHNMVDLLMQTDKVRPAIQVMRKLLHASERDSIRIPRQICEDLLAGTPRNEVIQKAYKYTLQMYFYTKAEYVPKNDPHWMIISLLNVPSKVELTVGEKLSHVST